MPAPARKRHGITTVVLPPGPLPSPTLRPLPHRVRPVTGETLASYLARLAAANQIDAETLAEYLSWPHARGSRVERVSLDLLAAATGRPARTLAYALPDLRRQYACRDPLHLAGRAGDRDPNHRRLACQRCMTARGITTAVEVWAGNHHNVCLRHQRWIGPGVRHVTEQLDVADLPELAHAQRRHQKLVRRHGDQVNLRYEASYEISDFATRSQLAPTARAARNRHFFTRERTSSLPWSYAFAAHYPDVVAVLVLLCSPYWRSLAASSDLYDTQRFLDQIRRAGLTNGEPVHNIPLRNWMIDLRHHQRSEQHATG